MLLVPSSLFCSTNVVRRWCVFLVCFRRGPAGAVPVQRGPDGRGGRGAADQLPPRPHHRQRGRPTHWHHSSHPTNINLGGENAEVVCVWGLPRRGDADLGDCQPLQVGRELCDSHHHAHTQAGTQDYPLPSQVRTPFLAHILYYTLREQPVKVYKGRFVLAYSPKSLFSFACAGIRRTPSLSRRRQSSTSSSWLGRDATTPHRTAPAARSGVTHAHHSPILMKRPPAET